MQFSVPKTRICYEQNWWSIVDFALCFTKSCCLEGVQRRIELLHTCTSQSRRFLTEICPNILERANRISLAHAWLCPPPCLFCPLWLIYSHWKRQAVVYLGFINIFGGPFCFEHAHVCAQLDNFASSLMDHSRRKWQITLRSSETSWKL